MIVFHLHIKKYTQKTMHANAHCGWADRKTHKNQTYFFYLSANKCCVFEELNLSDKKSRNQMSGVTNPNVFRQSSQGGHLIVLLSASRRLVPCSLSKDKCPFKCR